jgi:hypothetical protein
MLASKGSLITPALAGNYYLLFTLNHHGLCFGNLLLDDFLAKLMSRSLPSMPVNQRFAPLRLKDLCKFMGRWLQEKSVELRVLSFQF